MEATGRLLYILINSIIIRNRITRTLINRIVDNFNILKALLRFRPGIAGQTRLAYRACYFRISSGEEVKITCKGIFCGGRLVDNAVYQIMDFIPAGGISISGSDISGIKNTIRDALLNKGLPASRDYYRLRGLYKLVALGSLASIVFVAYRLCTQSGRVFSLKNGLEVLWLVPNIYFFIQTLLFYFSRLKHLSLKCSFEEASKDEEHKLGQAENQPYVISVVPAYIEEPDLLRRTLYSLCLQKYKNMKVVLLLGNDAYSRNGNEIENTMLTRRMVAEILLEMRKRKNIIRQSYRHFKTMNLSSAEDIKKEIQTVKELYGIIFVWLYRLAWEFKTSETKYPTDSYLIKHTLISQYKYYRRKSAGCRRLEAGIGGPGFSEAAAKEYIRQIEEFYKELRHVFGIRLEVFMRTKYENLEQQKTKAGNLTAYSSILGGSWSVKRSESGKRNLVSSERGKYIEPPKYFASFDCDTVVKPEYILRKVAFLERKENAGVGLVQSPYVIPDPEPTNVATASGIQSYWFLPISVGISTLKSAFWLGYNGLFRYEVIKEIKTFLTETVIEDTENSLKLKRAGYAIVTSPEEQCMTFSPLNLISLKIQRTRWSSGGFKIAKNLFKSFMRNDSGLNSLREKILSLNYILGLNLLPIMVTLVYILESPFNYRFYVIETIPFLLYLLSYFSLLKSLTKYELKHMLDGLSVSIFLNFYHLAGTAKSIKGLFIGKEKQFFKSTPRKNKQKGHSVGLVEIFGLLLFVSWMGFRLINQIALKVYYDIYPFLQLSLVIYGAYRFLGTDGTAESGQSREAQKNTKVEELMS